MENAVPIVEDNLLALVLYVVVAVARIFEIAADITTVFMEHSIVDDIVTLSIC